MTTAITDAQQRFFVEFDTTEECPLRFLGDPTVILFFCSWTFSARYGGDHELARASRHLEVRYRIPMRPFLRYADRNAETESDRRELERSWQPPAELAAAARAVAEAIEQPDEQLRALTAGYEHLAPRLRELAAMCDWAASRDARVRLSFDLDQPDRRAERPDQGPLLGPF